MAITGDRKTIVLILAKLHVTIILIRFILGISMFSINSGFFSTLIYVIAFSFAKLSLAFLLCLGLCGSSS